jgi:hypothetical protein
MDWWNPAIAVAGLLVGLVVGLTGMGGGALMTPTLVFFFGDFALGLTGSILVGAIPGVWVGARVSSRSPGSLVRRTLVVILLASGAKLLGASTSLVLLITATALVAGAGMWAWLRVRHGEAPLVWQERRRPRRGSPAVALPQLPPMGQATAPGPD